MLVGIDLAVMIDVENGKEALGILLHLGEREPAVMIAIGLREPVGERVVVTSCRTERLAHRADEHPAAAVR